MRWGWRLSIVAIAAACFMLGAVSPALAKDGVLVFGGTGRLGAPIVKLLIQAGEDVTVFARKGSDFSRLDGLRYTVATGDLLDDASIAAAFDARKYRVVIDAAAQRSDTRDPHFYETITRSIVTHAQRTGVTHFIHHGSIGAGENIKAVPFLKDYPQTPAMKDKGVAEQVITQSGLPYTIIRNGVLPNNEPLPAATHKAGLTVDHTTFSAITRDDLAVLTLDCIDNPARRNMIYHAIDATLPLPTE